MELDSSHCVRVATALRPALRAPVVIILTKILAAKDHAETLNTGFVWIFLQC